MEKLLRGATKREVFNIDIANSRVTRMSIERDISITLLKLVRDEPISHDLIKKDLKTSASVARNLLGKMQNRGLVYLEEEGVRADAAQRVKLAVNAIALGADIERISGFLRWQEFERMAAMTLEYGGYDVNRNVRFKHESQRMEIDLVGCMKPIVLCVDCKHWHRRLSISSLRAVVEKQVTRTQALKDSLPNPLVRIECTRWASADFVPAILSLYESDVRFCEGVPVVPVLRLQSFLNGLPVHLDQLKHLSKHFRAWSSF